jgi:cytochrome d ubiquinol oxidase subunit I
MTLDLSRWQFGITTVYHFIFVPLTIGLALLLAIMQSAAYRTNDPKWERMTLFWRRLFLINFALGVVTGIVQEFQFGMNWSEYSRYVGSVFGAPLAIEGLLAFFLESTFLGIWIFGKDRVSARIHLASIWMVSIGTMLSAVFILAANAWMQHPVGYRVVNNRAVMTNFWAVMTNSTLIGSFLHVLSAAMLTAAMLILGVSAWHLLRDGREDDPRSATSPSMAVADGADANDPPAAGAGTGSSVDVAPVVDQVFATSAKLALIVAAIAVVATMWFGDSQAKLMEKQQPMKMAAAEAIYNTQSGASFSLLTIGNLSGNPIFQIRLPHMLSVLADNSWNGSVDGINNVQAAEAATYGPGNYKPVFWVEYWTFRIMVGCGILMLLVAGIGLWLMRRKRLEHSRWFLRLALFSIALPFIANSTGWIFTEVGRQPWIVYGLLKTSAGVSHLGTGYVVTTLVGFTAIYTLLAVIDAGLMVRYARLQPPPTSADEHRDEGDSGIEDGDGTSGELPDRAPALVY